MPNLHLDQAKHPRLTRDFSGLDGQHYDLVVVGGGITGAGVARYAAASGLRVLLAEANDYGSGTSSRSTKLIHGGLRYLAMGDIALVREAALERKILHEMAPHLAEPRWMVLPAKSMFEWLKYRVGVRVYESLGAVLDSDRFSNSADADVQAAEPDLNWEEYPYACIYREYLTDDARLVLATLRSAVFHGAQLCSYCKVTDITALEQEDATDYRVSLTSSQGDPAHADHGATVSVTASSVVNAAGPWAESLLPTKVGPPRLRLSKGVHIVVPHKTLPVKNLVMIGTTDNRMLFVIPRGRHTYIGTTDTPHEGGPQTWPEVTAADVAYLLEPLARYFPKSSVSESDVVASWAGLRPLVNEPGKAPKEMSRKDEIWAVDGFISIAGGKLTGFRKMAESVLAEVGKALGRDLDAGPEQPLVGGDIPDLPALVEEVSVRYQQPQAIAERLVRLYGNEVCVMLGDSPEPISASMFAQEVRWAIQIEGAQSLEDVVYRRLRLAWFLPAEAEPALPAIADIAAELLGWSEVERLRQLAHCRARLASDLAFAA